MGTPATSVSDQVYQALQEDPRTSDELFEVGYFQGRLTLSGIVSTEQARKAAEEIARQNERVITVINEIKVK
jgi:osmotically-inducible protein OsmY